MRRAAPLDLDPLARLLEHHGPSPSEDVTLGGRRDRALLLPRVRRGAAALRARHPGRRGPGLRRLPRTAGQRSAPPRPDQEPGRRRGRGAVRARGKQRVRGAHACARCARCAPTSMRLGIHRGPVFRRLRRGDTLTPTKRRLLDQSVALIVKRRARAPTHRSAGFPPRPPHVAPGGCPRVLLSAPRAPALVYRSRRPKAGCQFPNSPARVVECLQVECRGPRTSRLSGFLCAAGRSDLCSCARRRGGDGRAAGELSPSGECWGWPMRSADEVWGGPSQTRANSATSTSWTTGPSAIAASSAALTPGQSSTGSRLIALARSSALGRVYSRVVSSRA